MVTRVAVLLAAGFAAGSAVAQPPARVVVATSTSPAATFASRPAAGTVFTTLPDRSELHAGDLVVSLPGGTLTSKNGAVTLRSLADFDGRSPLPILETAFALAEPREKGTDLELSLDRGRIDVTNTRAEGAAVASIRFRDQTWKITLEAPGARVSVEVCGRWPSGSRFKPGDPAKGPAPVATAVLLVLAGAAAVDIGGTTVSMKAPPGPAELLWDSVGGVRPQPQRLDKLPDWADPEAGLTDAGKKTAEACEKFRKARAEDPAKALDGFLTSADPVEVRVGLVTCGGLDDLDRLGKSLGSAKSLGEWDFGITVLRHWVGRGRGQDQLLYERLKAAGYAETEARIVLQLLFGFTPEDASAPETYEVLIDYLLHEKPAVRNLAAWHLVRLAPRGKDIPFKPGGAEVDAKKCHAAWKELIPTGKLPPVAKKE